MKRTAKGAAETIARYSNMRYALVVEGILVGIGAGALSVLYRFILEKANDIRAAALSFYTKGGLLPCLVWFAVLLLLALLTAFLLKWEPLIAGSGIPQVEAEMHGRMSPVWWRVILGKLAGGFFCIAAGLSLGREGPSIQLGAMAGKGISRSLGRLRTEERFLLTCGASAGLAAAFNAPLAGVMFALEEVHKNFSALVLVSAMAASVTADLISKLFFGVTPVFRFEVLGMVPLWTFGAVVLLGIICGVLGVVYNKTLVFSQKLYQKLPTAAARLVPAFLIAGVLGFVMPEVLGGGHHMIEGLTEGGGMALQTILLLLAVKFLFSMVSFGSGAPGGIFFPLLVLGAYIGGAFGQAVTSALGLDSAYLTNFIILAMAGYFSAIVRAPITGIILISEMTGSFQHLLTLSVVSITAYVTAEALKSKPVYESLLENLLRRQGRQMPRNEKEKVIISAGVDQGSRAAGKRVHELALPSHCVLVAIHGSRGEVIPRGDTVIEPGDTLVALTDSDRQAEVQEALDVLTTLRSLSELSI